jgi:hypothetical protein
MLSSVTTTWRRRHDVRGVTVYVVTSASMVMAAAVRNDDCCDSDWCKGDMRREVQRGPIVPTHRSSYRGAQRLRVFGPKREEVKGGSEKIT